MDILNNHIHFRHIQIKEFHNVVLHVKKKINKCNSFKNIIIGIEIFFMTYNECVTYMWTQYRELFPSRMHLVNHPIFTVHHYKPITYIYIYMLGQASNSGYQGY